MISNHTKVYGCYAIGLTKEWGIKNNLNPITYYNKDSSYIKSIKTNYDYNVELSRKIRKLETIEIPEDIYNSLGKPNQYMNNSFLNFKPI